MIVLVIFISTMAPVGMMLSLWKVQSINNNPTLETNGFPTSQLLLGIVCLMAGTNMIYMLSNDSCDPVCSLCQASMEDAEAVIRMAF